MVREVVAITTGVFYLDKTKWCVKDLKIGHRFDGTLFWYVCSMGCNFRSQFEAEDVAQDIATNMKVPFFFDIKHGTKITDYQKTLLEGYGVKGVK